MNQIIIDVRQPNEYASGHVDGALNIPLGRFREDMDELEGVDKDTPIILYCLSGGRSNMAMLNLKAWGYTNLTNGINKQRVEANL